MKYKNTHPKTNKQIIADSSPWLPLAAPCVMFNPTVIPEDGYGRIAHFYQRLRIPSGIRRRGREEEEEEEEEEECLKKERERPLG